MSIVTPVVNALRRQEAALPAILRARCPAEPREQRPPRLRVLEPTPKTPAISPLQTPVTPLCRIPPGVRDSARGCARELPSAARARRRGSHDRRQSAAPLRTAGVRRGLCEPVRELGRHARLRVLAGRRVDGGTRGRPATR